MLVYVLATRNFIVPLWNIFHIINESVISMFYASILMRYLPSTGVTWENVSALSIKLVFIAWGLNLLVSLTLTVIKVYQKIKEAMLKSRQKKNRDTHFGKVAPTYNNTTKFGFTTDS